MDASEPKIGPSLVLLGVLLIALIGINAFFVFEYPKTSVARFDQDDESTTYDTRAAYILPLSEPSYIPMLDTAVEQPIIEAKSIAIFDIRSERYLFDRDIRARLPVASLTKIMSAVVVMENFDLKDVVVVGESSIKVDGQKQTLYAGESMSVENLLKMMLIESSNDAAYALAEYGRSRAIDFVAEMNRKSLALGMNNTKFLDPAGLNDEAYSTAEDLVRITEYSLKYDLMWKILGEKNVIVRSTDEKIEHITTTTNMLLGALPNILGGKTGYTDTALGCLVLVVSVPDRDDNIISVVLGSKDRFGETEKLVNWIKKAYRWN
ncbi:MAG: hypothetical protein UW46_C0001G0029 [Candidatus Yanofskybacteria bacterium GW2011_GWF1_44_227]|uniref:Peptidase S11 D-alanyl-D-alanine carboxypeptidase A N-terminal domain-containing protein n=1 Tax=Candidatus Yanofskybacteria bacterium GW2011_GWE2_40_11 TaxID=1619033 RepID=A0A0G0TSJ3_9BACT|nr:MAG: hypothetical protein UT69_C0012G0021 [Candidatus Yanofskybacteria bacterium GW2011_GWE1_40_10]KKR40832.1 MAG: hypothetical protein UT75_C0004G0043 [Candidatus Yanofskybacteria bacterium GW2011_GWE2_40_11]KKT15947.1 MAG: hypothetical protein UV97_C0001G0120 [Candidatus Yanofskybacteria bacterium GW2011_GWF2_43_596]KKT53539.1 MAG: hypothetical protein UW46_C0001G0029 [Candidatus Yanofskybacteria bacterium GW2011_GWF1_44_227]OGN36064.1 MAG: hypothetical protein A2207_03335 [Candidatus Yano